jgi:hypothetical protein
MGTAGPIHKSQGRVTVLIAVFLATLLSGLLGVRPEVTCEAWGEGLHLDAHIDLFSPDRVLAKEVQIDVTQERMVSKQTAIKGGNT